MAKKAAKKAAKKSAKPVAAKKAKNAAKKGGARKANAAFMAPVTPSATLAPVVGDKPIPRTEVTKRLWAYIKKNNLQDQKNRRQINADAALKGVFGGKASVNMFEMTTPGRQAPQVTRCRAKEKRPGEPALVRGFLSPLFPCLRCFPVFAVGIRYQVLGIRRCGQVPLSVDHF